VGDVVKAVIREGGVRLVAGTRPRRLPGETLVAVRRAGICRTDLYVADGRLAVEEPRVLGHEAAGVVVESDEVLVGTRVAIQPALSCRVLGLAPCAACAVERPCSAPSMLGVDRDGAFAEVLAVPSRAVVRVPDDISWEVAAMAEPVAAALGVLRAPIPRGTRGAVAGKGRIAGLMVRVLEEAGHAPIPWTEKPTNLDWVVESGVADHALDCALSALKPGGMLVLKSRPPAGATFDVATAVRRELHIVARSYGAFDEAVTWLGRLRLEDLVGEVFPLDRFETAFEAARKDEKRKIFLAPEA
jgi:threonine dehydrogenase-like Zn-dependent dehydrogenase